MRQYIITAISPPIGACCYACGTSCAAPISVFWLFGVVSIIYGFMGGPLGEPQISWYTVGLGVLMWLISAVWALLSIKGVETDQCHTLLGNKDRHISPRLDEPDPMDEVKRA